MHGEVGGSDGGEDTQNGTPAADQQHVLIAGSGTKQRLVDVVSPHGRKGADVAGHAGHEPSDERSDTQAEQTGAGVACEEQGQNLVIGMLAGAGCSLTDQRQAAPRQHGESDQAGHDDNQGNKQFEGGADDGCHLCGPQITRCEDALHDEEIGRPVAECADEAKAEDDAGPVDAHGVGIEVAKRCPEVKITRVAGGVGQDAGLHAGPAARLNKPEHGYDQGSRPDEEELQNFIQDR